MTLEEFGYSAWFSEQIDPETEADLAVARVTAIHKGECEVSNGEETNAAKMTGRMRHQATSKLDYPTVGDWVLVKDFEDEERIARITRVLGRQSELKRKSSGRTTRYQLIAANIDTAFIMQTLGPGYNLKRLERYLVMVNESGIEPVVLLSKTDLLKPEELAVKMAEVEERMPGIRVLPFSNVDQAGLEEVTALFEPEKTYCVIGTSGVGKTTLLNSILGEEDFLFTLPVRESDGKGVHSTTWRELITLGNGAHVVDTPGMRELGNLDVNDGIEETFDDIMALAGACKFNDCSHVQTKGCAVIAAVERGEVSEARYNNYVRLMKEAAFHEQSALDKRDHDKKLSRFYRSVMVEKKKNSGKY
ncbi:Small ribosomal subunit biogenesis GTPase RsgA [Pontiella desulfatans]|uniref:Small ribosomal subunit biogenesis GTPase RsgA n=1 Tax=Pontiella desulfatans TaxID=2750659 RepID=A0A6C2UCF3_PONDE|nr:ribosome small subunit-dependent GTPase A [Pontiella desulfatans]VGO17257.1 Small ribosomal subunit biogenesis GTPase RsgA [Pontiella desulfatans]